MPQANRLREAVQLDTIDFGDVFAFTEIDAFTGEGWVMLRPGLTAKDGEAAQIEFKVYLSHCQTIQSDARSEFEAGFAELAPVACDHHRVAYPI